MGILDHRQGGGKGGIERERDNEVNVNNVKGEKKREQVRYLQSRMDLMEQVLIYEGTHQVLKFKLRRYFNIYSFN